MYLYQVELSSHLARQSEVEFKRALLWIQEDHNLIKINANYTEFREVGVLW